MWVWDQSAGTLSRDGKLVSRGYAGRDRGLNNPSMQGIAGIGPIPQGLWNIVGKPYDSPNTGKYTLRLEPAPGTNTLGRSAFRIHGDNARLNNTASKGCIILPRKIREMIYMSKDTILKVVE